MRGRLLHAIAIILGIACLLLSGVLASVWYTHDTRTVTWWPFKWNGERWRLVVSGDRLSVDNSLEWLAWSREQETASREVSELRLKRMHGEMAYSRPRNYVPYAGRLREVHDYPRPKWWTPEDDEALKRARRVTTIPPPPRTQRLSVPSSVACVTAAALGAAFLIPPWRRRARRRRRVAERQCLHCGYDLTGNVSGVCPECGNAK